MTLQLHINVITRRQNSLIQYRHSTHCIIHCIIHIFGQCLTTSSNHHRTSWHIHRIQSYHTARAGLILTRQAEFILFCQLLSHNLSRIIQLLEAIFIRNSVITNHLTQMLAKWFYHREYHTTTRRIHGISLHKVKLSIWHWLITRIQTVQIHHLHKQLILYCSVRDIVHINTTRIVLILNIQFKLLTLHLITTKIIDVLHHQVP